MQLPLPRLDLPASDFSENREESQIAEPLFSDDTALEPDAHHMYQEHASQHMRTLGSQPSHLVIFVCKDTIAPGSVDYQLANVEL